MNLSVDLQNSFECSLNNVLQFVEYLLTFYAICLVSSQKFKPKLTGSNYFSFDFEKDKVSDDSAAKTLFRKGVESGCQAFIVSENVFADFLSDFHKVHDESIPVFPNKHIVVYQSEVETEGNFMDFHSSRAIQDLPNILFIKYSDSDKAFDFQTTKFAGEIAESSKLFSLAKVSSDDDLSEKLDRVDLFPDKIVNLEGREVVLAIFNYMPYVLWREVNGSDDEANAKEKFLKTPLHIDGTENFVFIEFCKKFNCSLLISLDEAGEWGEISKNWTGNGILGAVAEKRADVGVGALYQWFESSWYLSLSKPISRTGITCITPKPNLLDPIGTPILPFSSLLWLAVFVSYFSSVLAYKALRFSQSHLIEETEGDSNETISQVFLNMLGIFVLQSVNISNRYASIMIFFFSVLIVGLMIGNSYSSALASVLTIPRYEKAIDTVEDLAASGTEWGSTHDAWIFSIQLATQPMILQLLATFRTPTKEILEQRAIKQDLSFSIERLPYGHYAIGEYITEDTVNNYQTLQDDIYYEMCVAMSTKTWPMLSHLNDLILKITESGLQQFVELDVVVRNSNNKIQKAVEHSRHRQNMGPIKLTPSHITGPLILLGIGVLVSTLAFLAELGVEKYKSGGVVGVSELTFERRELVVNFLEASSSSDY